MRRSAPSSALPATRCSTARGRASARRASRLNRHKENDALAAKWLLRGDERPATEVWDAAAEVVDALAKRERDAWAADRQMVADMERDGLL